MLMRRYRSSLLIVGEGDDSGRRNCAAAFFSLPPSSRSANRSCRLLSIDTSSARIIRFLSFGCSRARARPGRRRAALPSSASPPSRIVPAPTMYAATARSRPPERKISRPRHRGRFNIEARPAHNDWEPPPRRECRRHSRKPRRHTAPRSNSHPVGTRSSIW